MNKNLLLEQIAHLIDDAVFSDSGPLASDAIAKDIWDLLGLDVVVKRPIVFGYEPHQQWLPGSKRLVSGWIEDEVVCKHCEEQIFKDGNLPWQDAYANDECADDSGLKHAPRRS